MWSDTTVSRLFGVELPIVQAPLGGGPGTAALTAAVSAAGGLGILGLGYLPPDQAHAMVRGVRALTDRPFGANLFLPEPAQPDDDRVLDAARRALVPFREAVGLPGPTPPTTRLGPEDLDAQLEVLLAERVPVVGFTFGAPDRERVARVHASGAIVTGSATTVAEGRALQDVGVDVVVGQGTEAGGHRASFGAATDPVGLVALVPALVDALDVPVIASGGIMDGRGIVAALALGAGAAQLGTAFLRSAEAGTNPAYRAALAAAGPDATVLTDRFSGKPARGIRNRFIDTFPDIAVPPYPVMNALTRELRAHAAQQGRADLLSLWAGQGVGHSRERPAGQLVAELAAEVEQVLARWA